jgi:hypothetical protein
MHCTALQQVAQVDPGTPEQVRTAVEQTPTWYPVQNAAEIVKFQETGGRTGGRTGRIARNTQE